MNNEKINKDINDFLKYLFSIGIINQSTIKDVISHIVQLHDIEKFKKLSFVKFSHIFLTEYLKSLDTSLIHVLSSDIISNYINNHCHTHSRSNYYEGESGFSNKILEKLIFSYSKRRNLNFLRLFFLKWKKKIKKKNLVHENNHVIQMQDKLNYNYNYSNSNSITHNHYHNHVYQEKDYYKENKKILTTQERQEIEEFKNCTFHPKINKKSKTMSRFYNNELNNTTEDLSSQNKQITSIDSTFDRLYLDYDRIIKNRNLKKQEFDNRENKLLRSTPSILNSSHSNKLLKNLDYLSKSFIDRQEEYILKREKTFQKVKNTSEESDNQVFTFNPTINELSSKIEYAFPVYDRLYNDNKRRIENANIVQINYEKNIRNKSKSKSKSRSRKNVKDTKFNQNKIEELYQDYKIREMKKKTLLNTINQEDGITFTPKTNQNKKFQNKPLLSIDFHKRNEILLQNKKEFVYYMKKLEEEEIEEGRRIFPKEKREKIEKDVVERLYNPSGILSSRTMKSFTNKKNLKKTIESEGEEGKGKIY